MALAFYSQLTDLPSHPTYFNPFTPPLRPLPLQLLPHISPERVRWGSVKNGNEEAKEERGWLCGLRNSSPRGEGEREKNGGRGWRVRDQP